MLDKILPPTDSLYKFMAITGLLLVVVSFVPTYFIFQLERQLIEYEKQSDLFDVQINRLGESQREKVHSEAGTLNEFMMRSVVRAP